MIRPLRFLLCSILCLLALALRPAPLRAQTWDRAQALGATPANGNANSYAAVTDAAGNTYVTGYFTGTAVFGSSTATTGSPLSSGAYVAKISPAGQWLWVAQTTSASSVTGNSLALDAAGNVYVAGYYSGRTATFGNTTLTTASTATYPFTAFVAKLSASGQWLWAAQNAGGIAQAAGVAVDGAGNAYVTGIFHSASATFGSTTLPHSSSDAAAFVAKVDASGQWLWAVRSTNSGLGSQGRGTAVAADASGNVLVTGWFDGPTLTLGSTTLSNGGFRDVFVAKLSPSGQWLWATKAGGSSFDAGTDIAVDASGNAYVTGGVASTALVFGSITLAGNGSSDVFVAKLSASGTWLWANKTSGVNSEEVSSLALDGSGNVVVAGNYRGSSLVFDSITLTNTSSGPTGYVAKLNPSGQWLWAAQPTGLAYSLFSGVATDASGNVYVAGNYDSGNLTFGSTTLGDNYGGAVLVARLSAAGQWQWAARHDGGNAKFVRSFAADAAGNTYVAGHFYGSCTFGSTTLTSAGQNDAFVGKLNSAGQWLWVRSIGNARDENAQRVAVDGSGNVYVIGNYQSLALTIGTTALSGNVAGRSAFVAKLDAAGQWQWATSISNAETFELRLAVDAAGNSSVAGSFSEPLQLGSFSLTPTGSSYDGFVARLSPSGQPQWLQQVGSAGTDYAMALTQDAAGNTFVGGFFSGPSLTLGAQTLPNTPNRSQVFVAKLNPSGQWQWAAGSTGPNYAGLYDLATDASGNVLGAGYLTGTATFGPSTVAATDSSDVLVTKLNAAGQWLWATKAGTVGSNGARAICVDAAGDAYLTGGSAAQRISFGSQTFTSSGRFGDAYVAKISAGGQWLWAIRADPQGASAGSGIAWDPAGYLTVAGNYGQGPLTLGATTLVGGPGPNNTGFLARVSTTVTAVKPAGRGAQLAEVYPNPFSQQLTVRLPQGGPAELRVTDALGRLRLQRRVAAGAGQALVLPEVAAWPAGVYLLTIHQDQQQRVLQVVRQ